ncbi:Uncharacterized protein HZ326_13661 [Fusarium oxysporum f. sp. albedinis]|nr:Uncharacterized protein HZ326_13661 [Fusarium oxysporum f. sp. albedinis]
MSRFQYDMYLRAVAIRTTKRQDMFQPEASPRSKRSRYPKVNSQIQESHACLFRVHCRCKSQVYGLESRTRQRG